jgi:hypothetical protein
MSSGKKQPDATADDVPPDIDAYPIAIPQAFLDAFAGDTVAEKLINAEAAPAHDADTIEHAECPRCGSVRLSPKGGGSQSTKKTDGYVCDGCRTHCSDPEHPETAEIVFSDSQTQLGRWSE